MLATDNSLSELGPSELNTLFRLHKLDEFYEDDLSGVDTSPSK